MNNYRALWDLLQRVDDQLSLLLLKLVNPGFLVGVLHLQLVHHGIKEEIANPVE